MEWDCGSILEAVGTTSHSSLDMILETALKFGFGMTPLKVKSYYRLLRRDGLNFPRRSIWKARIPHQGWLSFSGVWLWGRF